VVRRTGGLADTVTPWDPQAKTGSGFLFDEFSSHALLATMEWVLRNWQDQQGWRQLVLNAMAVDFSWQKQGPEYVALYRALAAPR
jgi:starch synthase